MRDETPRGRGPDPAPAETPEGWRRRALDAEARLKELRERLLALALVLPPEYLGYLDGDSPALDEAAATAELFLGWDDTPFLTPSHVFDEMDRLWKRLPRREGG